MKVDLKKLNELVEQHYLSVQKHPIRELYIYNYTQKCQYERFWTEETMMCRGLIVDKEGTIIARPFKKFFNYEEHTGEDSKLPSLPLEEFKVTEKLDGSLGILYFIGDTPYLATRGSFISDQAIKGTEILHKKYSHVKFNPNYTYLFEIIFPSNRIVVDYGDTEDIILIGLIHTESGEDCSFEDYLDVVPIVKFIDGVKDISFLTKLTEGNKEGFVVWFESGMRVKLKFEEYVRLHRLVTGVNAKTIWEHLKDGTGVEEIINRVPDEFYKWVNKTVKELMTKFINIEGESLTDYGKVRHMATRKEQALFLQKNSKYPGVVFKRLDNQPYDQIIWKLCKPVAEKPFKEDIDA